MELAHRRMSGRKICASLVFCDLGGLCREASTHKKLHEIAPNNYLQLARSCVVLWHSYSTMIMQTTQDSLITDKTRELCQAILDQSEMRSARERIQAFVGDDKARTQYEGL